MTTAFETRRAFAAPEVTESSEQSVGEAEGEHTRPRVFRTAPSLLGGWKWGSVSPWDHGSKPSGVSTAHRPPPTAVFQHVPTGIRMHDVHAGNFIRQKNGILIPIDVFFEGIPATPG